MLFAYAAYLILYSGVFHSSDARFILAATESIVKRGDFVTGQLWWHQDAIESVAPDGEPYSKYGISTSLLAAPLYVLGLSWPRLGMIQAAMLTTLLVTAINVVLVFKLIGALGYRTGIALGTSLVFALGTSVAVYAHYYFTEPFSALALTGSFLGLYLYRAHRQERYAWLTGGAMSLAVSTKLINALFLLPLLVYALEGLRTQYSESRSGQDKRSLADAGKGLRAVLPIGLPLLVTFALLGLLNTLRFGSPFASGYPAWERFDHPLLAGLWGLLFGSEKGLFAYNPILVASLFAFPFFWRRHRPEALVVLLMLVLHLVTYARWHDWRGGVAWGPRFLVPLLPLLVLPLAEFWPARTSGGVRSSCGRIWKGTLTGGAVKWAVYVGLLIVAGMSLGVQIVGSAVSFLRYGDQYGQIASQINSSLFRLGQRWPVWGHTLLSFDPANWDAAWVQVSGDQIRIDWITLVMLLGFLLLAAGGLAVAYHNRHTRPGRWLALFQFTLIVLAAFVSLALLARSRDDNRFGGGEDYHALLQTLAAVSLPGDLVLLNNHIYTDFFLNHNRSLARWYALDRHVGVDKRTEGLLAHSLQRYRRIWLVTDLSPDITTDRPVEAWLTQHTFKLSEVAFSPYARLVSYVVQASSQAASTRQPLNVRLGDSIELTAFDLTFLTRSEPLLLTLYWQAHETLPQDLTVFVQVLDARDQLVWQVDRYPVDGFRPTSSWEVGELIVDRYGWQLPPELAPGEYRLIVGLYDWRTGQRLRVSDSHSALLGDYVLLGVLSIPPP
ncbi:MAG: hypothetical protein Kow0063_32210 [Anaerolineae bacterium]